MNTLRLHLNKPPMPPTNGNGAPTSHRPHNDAA